jgi:hypothetical protein
MRALAYLGEAVDAAGYRLAGALVLSPKPGAEAAALAQARAGARVVLLSPQVAEALPRAELDAALAALQPLTAIVPGRDGAIAVDPSERVRAQLGLDR